MLPQENRITAKQDFDEVKEKGKIVQSDSFAFAYLAKNEVNPSRFGFVVSTKISKAATLRNRVKRALREAVRQNLLYTKKGIDGVFLAKTAILKKSTPDIMNEVKQVLASIKII